MRPRSVFPLVLCLLLLPTLAWADSITNISPSSFTQFSAESNITIDGTGLQGAVSTSVTFSGPGGTGTTPPSIVSPTQLFVPVPDPVLSVPGTVSVTVIADDGTGTRTIGPGTFTVTALSAQQPPLLSIPEVVVAEATSPAGAAVSFTVSGFSYVDPPPAPTITCVLFPSGGAAVSGATYPIGQTTVRCTATDSFASTTGDFVIVVSDTTPPVLTVPADIVTNNPVVTFTVTATDNIDGNRPVTCTPPSGSTFPAGTTTVVCSAADLSNNTQFASFNVTVGIPPTLTLPADITAEATSPAGAVVTFTATADQGATVSCSPSSGSTFGLGTSTVVCTATNPSTNLSSSGSFHINVVDTTPPSLNLPADVTAEATGPNGATVTFSATAADIVDGSVTPVCTPASGSVFPLGTTTVSCVATDAHNNSSTGTFKVTVRDTTPPALTLPADITAEATGPNGATVTYIATAADLVDGSVTPVCTPASGSVFPLGTTTVSCVATDAHNNSSTGTFKVTVRDTTPPTIVDSSASPSNLWPPNHKMVDVTITVHAVDLVDGAPTYQIISVSSNQPVNGTGDGNTSPDWIITGAHTVQLRSERASGEDRVYTITFAVTDFSGNVATGTVTVTVSQSNRRRAA